ncbi:MAG: hypothetical protein FWF50_03530, partial [Defluviitaleaceae bacterium]|nr:hypothetical protein [Defluviitaleaceae bacterium]
MAFKPKKIFFDKFLALIILQALIFNSLPINILAEVSSYERGFSETTQNNIEFYEEDNTDDIPYEYERVERDEEYYRHYEEDYDDSYLYEGLSPEYEAPPARMSDIEIISLAISPINENTVVYIDTLDHLLAFLNSSFSTDGRDFTNDSGHFVLTSNITLNVATEGRRGVFTGIFDGQGNTITNLRLRPPGNFARQGIGFVQLAGENAVIRNVNFHETSAVSAPGDLTNSWLENGIGADWENSQTGIGMVIGRTVAYDGKKSIVSIYNVHLTGQMTMVQNRLTTAGYTARRIGGMVGQVDRNSVLNIRNVSIQDLDIFANPQTQNRIHAAGGLVGAIEGGTLNITANEGAVNSVSVIMRGGGRTNVVAGVNRGGGVLGFLFNGHANIENTETLPPLNAAGAIRAANDGIHAIQMGGGIVGGSEVTGSIALRNVTSNVHRVRVTMAGGDTSANGRVGGLIGRVRNTVTIENSRNYATVYQLGANAVIGGLIGYTGPVSVVRIENSANGRFIPNFVSGTGNAGATNPDALIGQLRHWNSSSSTGANGFTPGGGSAHQLGRAEMGGIIGRSRGRLYITDTRNYGFINKRRANNNNTHVGGIIGRLHRPPSGEVFINGNVVNRGEVFLGGSGSGLAPTARGNIGGLIGTITGNGNTRIAVNEAVNNGPVVGGARNGGLVGQIASNGVTISNSFNNGDTEGAPNWDTGTTAASDNRPAATAARASVASAGGIVGLASGTRLTITNTANSGVVSIRAAAAAQRPANSGGLVGQIAGANAFLRDVSNYAAINGRERTGGIVGRVVGVDATITNALNYGTITTHTAANPVGGIVGRSERRNLVIRNAGNFGVIGGGSGTGGNSASGGILGRDQGASTRVL